MDETVLSLEEEARETAAMDEVQNIMAECFGFGISMEAVADLRDVNEPEWQEGHQFGFADTAVREALMSAFSMLLLGVPAPTYGEARERELDMDFYFEEIKRVHDLKYGVQPVPYWMEEN